MAKHAFALAFGVCLSQRYPENGRAPPVERPDRKPSAHPPLEEIGAMPFHKFVSLC